MGVRLRGKSWLIPPRRVPSLSHWSKTLPWYEHKLHHGPITITVSACAWVCVLVCVYRCVRALALPPVCLCSCMDMQKAVGVACVRVCAHMHPPSPEAALCIVVGMAYMLSQACFGVVQCTRLPIRAALPRSCPQAGSFTFAPELMLVNCHITSDLLPHFVNNTNRARSAPPTL